MYGTPSGFGNRSRTSWKRYIAIDRTCTVKWASFITYSIIIIIAAQVEIKMFKIIIVMVELSTSE